MNATITINGRTFTAPTKRAYTHAVVWTRGDLVAVRGWCGSLELAEKAARKESSPVAPRGVRTYGASRNLYAPAPTGTYYIVEVGTDEATIYAEVGA